MIVDGPSPFVLFRGPPGQPVEETPAVDGAAAQYFHARAVAERAAADAATTPEASRRHQELAQAYATLASETKSGGRP